MSTVISNIPDLVRGWSRQERQIALATILRDYVSECGAEPLPIEDESSQTVGYLTPRSSSKESNVVNLDDSTPYLRELRNRVETLENSISLDEFIEREDRLDAETGRE